MGLCNSAKEKEEEEGGDTVIAYNHKKKRASEIRINGRAIEVRRFGDWQIWRELDHEPNWAEVANIIPESCILLDGFIPEDKDIEEWLFGEELCESVDGCTVEVDGTCPHGFPSWLIALGIA